MRLLVRQSGKGADAMKMWVSDTAYMFTRRVVYL